MSSCYACIFSFALTVPFALIEHARAFARAPAAPTFMGFPRPPATLKKFATLPLRQNGNYLEQLIAPLVVALYAHALADPSFQVRR